MGTKAEQVDTNGVVETTLDVSQELARALELTGEQRIVTHKALNRIDYDRQGRRIGGALVIECAVLDGDLPQPARIVEINDDRRPMSEAAITHLGLEAIDWQNRGFVIRRDCLV